MSRRQPGLINPDWLAERSYKDGFSNFPSNPRHGQLHFPAGLTSEDPEWAYYDENYDDWLSMGLFELEGKQYGTSSTVQGLHQDYGGSTIWRFGGTAVGVSFPYPVRLVSMSAHVGASSTCTFGVRVAGVAKTNATLALSAALNNQADGYTNVTQFAAGNVIQLYLEAGTITVGGICRANFRRLLT